MSGRVHEWAWGEVGTRTVCGRGETYISRHDQAIVCNLGAVALDKRCKNCERMRAAIGASKPVKP